MTPSLFWIFSSTSKCGYTQKCSCTQRHSLESNTPCYWVIKVINFGKIFFEGTKSSLTVCLLGFFTSTAFPTENPSTGCVSEASLNPYQPNSSKVQSACPVWLPVFSSHSGWTHNPLPLIKKKKFFFFLERIPILRVHLLSLFISGMLGTPCHATFHKATSFVHCKMKWSLLSPLSAEGNYLRSSQSLKRGLEGQEETRPFYKVRPEEQIIEPQQTTERPHAEASQKLKRT